LGAFKNMMNDIPSWSDKLDVRRRIADKTWYLLLKGRKDLLFYLDTIVDLTFLSKQAFDSGVFCILAHGRCENLDILHNNRIFNRCYECAASALKLWQVACRSDTLRDHDDTDAFNWQYASQMLGRLDHPHFVDTDDFEDRTDYDILKMKNKFSPLVPEFEKEFRKEIIKEGTRYGKIIDVKTDKKAYAIIPEHSFLTEVAPGSIGSAYLNEDILSELGKERANKKISFAYMKKKDIKRLKSKKEKHSWSSFSIKHELAKERNLAPGSLALYYYSCIVSTPAETAYMATLPEVPIHLTQNRFTKRIDEFRRVARHSYVACRDYANYNVAHKHEDIKLFYSSIKEGLHPQTHAIMHDALDSILECMDTVGIKGPNGELYRWNYGLMSGWRHTMLINTAFNAIISRVAHRMLMKYEKIECYDTLAVGDDSTECYSHPLGGPWVQALLDAVGRVGKPEKQIFHQKKNGFIEFLRILYTDKGTFASGVRATCAFVCPDTQSPVPLGGPEMATAIVDCIGRIERRVGHVFLRRGDILAMIKYWINSPENIEFGTFVPPLAAFCPTTIGGLGCVHPLFSPDEISGSGYTKSNFRGEHFDQSKLDRTIKGKIRKIATNLDLTDYAHEYAQDTLLSALQKVKTLVWSKHKSTKTEQDVFLFNKDEKTFYTETSKPNHNHSSQVITLVPVLETVQNTEGKPSVLPNRGRKLPEIRRDLISHLTADARECITKGLTIPLNFEETLKEIAISTYFAGSHMVCNKYISEVPLNEIDCTGHTFKEAHKGLVLLYSRNTELPSIWLPQQYPSFYSPLTAAYVTRHNLTVAEQYALAVSIGSSLYEANYRTS
jgi:hypothetical protein